jgi:2-polyprenyl-3-methyl-5-hydroxy-6-metoxy-1,4-benzoquinol methylase
VNQAKLEAASGGTVLQTKYLKKNPLRRYLIGQYLDAIAELARVTAARQVLDVGCGEGFVIQHLRRERPGLSLVGVDIVSPVLKVAAYQNPASFFAVASCGQLPWADSRFDLVLCNEVLEHLVEPDEALGEIARVGRDHFIFSVPHEPRYRLANMLAGANWSRWGDDADHRQRWTRSQFISFLGRRFEVVDVRTPFPWLMVLCRRDRR